MDCPQPIIWFSIATGLLPKAKAIQYLNHAGQCRFCAKLLQNAMEDVAEEAPLPETQQNLRSTQKPWQEELARKMDLLSKQKRQVETSRAKVASPLRQGARVLRFPGWAYAATAAIAVSSSVIFWLCQVSPEKLLQEAYAQDRTVELRLDKTEYAPYRVERGTGASRINSTSALLHAEIAILDKVKKQPADATLLREQGSVELLKGRVDRAIQNLLKAQDIEPGVPSLKLALAVAYFQRAEASGRAIDYSTAYELLGEVLAKNPDDQVALFDHAIICDRMFFFHEEISDWEHYLRLDPKGGWAEEARQHLVETRDKLKKHERKRASPLLSPTEFLRDVSPTDERTWRIVDLRIHVK